MLTGCVGKTDMLDSLSKVGLNSEQSQSSAAVQQKPVKPTSSIPSKAKPDEKPLASASNDEILSIKEDKQSSTPTADKISSGNKYANKKSATVPGEVISLDDDSSDNDDDAVKSLDESSQEMTGTVQDYASFLNELDVNSLPSSGGATAVAPAAVDQQDRSMSLVMQTVVDDDDTSASVHKSGRSSADEANDAFASCATFPGEQLNGVTGKKCAECHYLMKSSDHYL